MTHYHYKVICFDKIENNVYVNPIQLTVVDCQTEEQAIEKAKKTINRNDYKVSEAWECNTCALEGEKMGMLHYMVSVLRKINQ